MVTCCCSGSGFRRAPLSNAPRLLRFRHSGRNRLRARRKAPQRPGPLRLMTAAGMLLTPAECPLMTDCVEKREAQRRLKARRLWKPHEFAEVSCGLPHLTPSNSSNGRLQARVRADLRSRAGIVMVSSNGHRRARDKRLVLGLVHGGWRSASCGRNNTAGRKCWNVYRMPCKCARQGLDIPQ